MYERKKKMSRGNANDMNERKMQGKQQQQQKYK